MTCFVKTNEGQKMFYRLNNVSNHFILFFLSLLVHKDPSAKP